MKNESQSLYEKAVALINELSKKADYSLVRNFHTTKAIQIKLNQMPVVINKISPLVAREKSPDLYCVKILHSSVEHAIIVTDEKDVLLFKEELPTTVNYEKLNYLFVKYKMQHAAYPSFFLIENPFDEK